jgi:hypothetical protein
MKLTDINKVNVLYAKRNHILTQIEAVKNGQVEILIRGVSIVGDELGLMKSKLIETYNVNLKATNDALTSLGVDL